MKKCKYCGQVGADNAAVCGSCGSNQFAFICANCGNEFDNGMHCPRCGVKVGQKEKVCPRCGSRYFTNACGACGYMEINTGSAQQSFRTAPAYTQNITNVIVQNSPQAAPVRGNPKNKYAALLLCFFFGVFGVHKFYEGKIGLGILYLFTCGIVGIGWLADLIVLLFKPTTYYV